YEEDIIARTHLNNVTFIKPVYPNDNLYVKVKVLDKKLKKQFGSLTVEVMTFNQYEEDIIARTHLNNVTFIKPVYPNDNLYVKVKV
ncbi:MaoC/PaaZ C-terminal domain-containing protein, partial [Streptococcus pneumoniae]|uniref:MaoC/PaaZ C-terminal domain-containing protein n=1 Tax=Streptococcus pneumoniae TaxID=1313 RepID=UPI001254777C